jgi:hypothetical protein
MWGLRNGPAHASESHVPGVALALRLLVAAGAAKSSDKAVSSSKSQKKATNRSRLRIGCSHY